MRDEELMWFDNPPRRRGKRKRKGKRRRKLYGAAAAAHAKKVGRRRKPSRKRRKGVRHVAKRRRKLYGAAAAAHARKRGRGGRRRAASHRRSGGRRKYRRTSRAVARRAGRQLRYRRSNPPFKGLVGQLMDGAVDATEVVLGKAAARIIPSFANLPQAGAVGLAVQVASALVAGYVAKRFVGHNASKMVLAGGLSAPIESFIKSLNIPLVSAALGDGEGYYAVGAYPMAPGVGAYPQQSLSGDDDGDYSAMYTG